MMQARFIHTLRQLTNRYHWANRIDGARQSVAQIRGQLTHTRIALQGSGNQLEVPDTSTLKHTDILLRGTNNRITLGERVYLDGKFVSNNIWGD